MKLSKKKLSLQHEKTTQAEVTRIILITLAIFNLSDIMKNRYLVIIVMLLFNFTAKTQISFEKIISRGSSEWPVSVIQTTDGGYAFIGYGTTSKDFWLVKTNSTGDTLWSKTFRKAGYTCCDRALVQTADGGFTFISNRNGKAGLLHTSSTGDSLWEKELFTGTGHALAQSDDDGYVVTGSTPNFSVAISRAGANGDTVWNKQYRLQPFPYSLYFRSWGIRGTSGGGFIVTGASESNYFMNTPFMLQLGPGGDSLWYRNYGWWLDSPFCSVDTIRSGGFFACGYVQPGNDAMVTKLNTAGDTIWSRIIPNPGWQRLYSIRATGDGGAVACGNYDPHFMDDSSETYLVKFSASGSLLWEKRFGIGKYAKSYGMSVECTSDSGYIIGANGWITVAAKSRCLLIKTDKNGALSGMSDPVDRVGINLFPNPASGKTTLSITPEALAFNASLALYDVFGRQVKEIGLQPWQSSIQLDVSDLPQGIYIVLVRSQGWVLAQEKLVISSGR